MKRTSRTPRVKGLSASEIDALQLHRLEADLSYRALAIKVGLSLGKLHELLNDQGVIANDRTAFKVRRYLSQVDRRTTRRAVVA